MGYIKHHAIVIASFDEELILKAHTKANELCEGLVSELISYRINGGKSFFIAPDGSKEGWDESNQMNESRESFIDWVNEQAYEDESNALSFAELFFGEDNGESRVTEHN